MFDHSNHNQKIMALARDAANRLDHGYIGTEHLLLALLELDHCVAAEILNAIEVDRGAMQTALEEQVEQRSYETPAEAGAELPFTPAAKRVLELSLEESKQLEHDHIGSEHLLLALTRAKDSTAGQALRDAGVDLERARAALLDFLSSPSTHNPMPRQLLLISNSTMHGGGYLAHCRDEIRDFLDSGQRVAFVPYALADHDGYEAKAKAAFAEIDHELVSVHRGSDPCAELDGAGAVFVGGGNTFRLLDTLYRTGLLQAIRDRVDSGMRYIGSSAGTNVATLSIKTTNDMPIVMPPSFDALALLPFQINPHYLDPDPGSTHMGETREERLMQFHEQNDTPVLALREGCMLRVDGDGMQLRGTTGARLFRSGQQPEEFTPPCDLSFLLKTSTNR